MVEQNSPIPLKCPTCGRPLRLPSQLPRGEGFVVLECPEDGLFQVGPNAVLTRERLWKQLVFWLLLVVLGGVIWLYADRMAQP